MKKILLLLLLSPIFLMPEGMNFEEYKTTDANTAANRLNENQLQDKEWAQEDQRKADIRNKEHFIVRAFKALSSDGAEDSATAKERNKLRLERNRARLLEDFDIRQTRINNFKAAHADFAKDKNWSKLLELGDMKSFMDKTGTERTAFVENIKTSVKNLTADNAIVSEQNVSALQDLIKLTTHNFDISKEMPTDTTELSKAATTEATSLGLQDQTEINGSLSDALKSSLETQIKALEGFNNGLGDLNEDIKSLKNIRLLKNIGITAFLVLGTVAAVFMLAHAAIIIGPIVLGMEVFAIAAKVAFVVYHKAGHAEDEKSIKIQNDFMKTTTALMPETAKFLEAKAYESKAESLTDRMDEGIKSTLGKTGNKYYESAKTKIKSAAKSVSDFNGRIANRISDAIKSDSKSKKSSSDDILQNEFSPITQNTDQKPIAENQSPKTDTADGDNVPYQIPA